MKKNILVILSIMLVVSLFTACSRIESVNNKAEYNTSQDITSFEFATEYSNNPIDWILGQVQGKLCRVKINYVYSKKSGYTINIDDKYVNDVEVTEKNGKLTVTAEERILRDVSQFDITIFAPTLTDIVLSAKNEFITDDQIKGKTLEIETAGDSLLNIDIDVKTFEVDSSGAIELIARGSSEDVEVSMAGPAELELTELKMENLYAISSGMSNVFANPVGMLELRGSGRLKYKSEIKVKNADVDISGSSNLALNVSESLKIKASGSVEIVASDTPTKEVHIETSGSARITVYASEILNIEASGSGKISYKGEPEVSKDISGNVTVSKIK